MREENMRHVALSMDMAFGLCRSHSLIPASKICLILLFSLWLSVDFFHKEALSTVTVFSMRHLALLVSRHAFRVRANWQENIGLGWIFRVTCIFTGYWDCTQACLYGNLGLN